MDQQSNSDEVSTPTPIPDQFMPKLGHKLEGAGMDMVIQAFLKRRENYPDEDISLTLGLILSAIGTRFDPLRCVEKEWRGYKKDIPPGTTNPTCPNGHDLIAERGVTLGWVMNTKD